MNEKAIVLEMDIKCDLNQASTDGNLITNEFKIEVLPLLDSCLCYSDQPINQLDIKIFNQQATCPKPTLANSVNPVLEETQILTLGEEYRMTKDFQNELFINQSVDYPEEQKPNK